MPFTYYAIDKFISQDLSKLAACNMPDLSQFENAKSWVANFILNSIFRVTVDQKTKQLIFAFLRHSEMAFMEYTSAKTELQEYIAGPKDRVSTYFRALYHLESTLALADRAYEFLRKFTNQKFFEKNDGSALDRLRRIYNISRHLEQSTMSEEQLHPIWITNQGINTSKCTLSFEELKELLIEIASCADKLEKVRG